MNHKGSKNTYKEKNYLKLYEKFYNLSTLFRYHSIYLEMEYHLKQVLNGKEDEYFKNIYHHDRNNIGNIATLARLSAKYDIPVIVSTYIWKRLIEKDIPDYLPKYFKKKHPTAIVANENCKGKRYDVLLVDERVSQECWQEYLQWQNIL